MARLSAGCRCPANGQGGAGDFAWVAAPFAVPEDARGQERQDDDREDDRLDMLRDAADADP